MKKYNLLMLKIVFFCGGIFIICTGKAFIILANLGADPWNVFHVGLARYLPFTIGRIVQVVGAIMLMIGWILKIKPTGGTFANMYLFGFFLDFILERNFIKPPQDSVVSWIYLILGTLICGIGFGIYLNGNLGAGPRDSFMLGMVKVTGKSAGTIKTIMEGTAVFVGWLLGGPAGLGTIVYTALVGTIMQWTLDHITLPKKEVLEDNVYNKNQNTKI